MVGVKKGNRRSGCGRDGVACCRGLVKLPVDRCSRLDGSGGDPVWVGCQWYGKPTADQKKFSGGLTARLVNVESVDIF